MKAAGTLVAERAAANHCAELLREAPGPEALMPLLDRAAERLARTLAAALAPLVGGKGTLVKAPAARRTDLDDLTMFSPTLAAWSLLAVGPEGMPLAISLDAAAVLRMVDRTFGGRGKAPSPLPDEFPVSAELLIQRLEATVIEQLCAVLRPDEPEWIVPVRRSGALAELDPFPRTEPIAAVELEVTEPAGDTWLVTLALPLPTLVAAFGAAPRRSSGGRAADPLAAPFADLRLGLRAVLVDMKMPMATLAALRPGAVIPVAVARQVPLRLGQRTLATGTVGAAEDRVALQITAAFSDAS